MRHWLAAGVFCALAAGGLSLADADKTKEADKFIARIKGVGREGANNDKAAAAWKKLIALGPEALVPVAGSLSDDDLTSSNWLRPAFEAIAEKAVEDRNLPVKELEKFVTYTKNSRSGRRLAYEWLIQVDRKAPSRLLPTMLKDPSPELRRDAVAHAMAEAKGLLDKKDKDGARKGYQKALGGACDDDQVTSIAKALSGLGVKVDLPKHFGFVVRWHLAAPFEHSKGVGWDKVYGPEKGVNLADTYEGKGGAQVKWVAHATTDDRGLVDLNKALGKFKGAIAYAYAEVDAPEAQEVELRAGCINGLKMFVNGKEVFALEE